MIGQIPSAAITLLVVKAFCYLFPVPFLIKIYRKYKHISYLGFAIADILLFFSSTLGYGLVYLPNTNINAIWILSNMHLYASLWVIILSLLIAQFEKVPPLSHLITLVFGILFGLIVNTGNFTLSLENSIYQASYSNSISILGLVLYLNFFFFALKPLIQKIRSGKIDAKKTQYRILFASYLIITTWIAFLPLSSIKFFRFYRTVALSVGMALWGYALYLDPRMLVITRNEIQKALILTKNGVPIFSYDFKKEEEINTELISGLLSAIRSSSQHIFSSEESSLEGMSFATSKLHFVEANHVVLVLISSSELSTNLELIGRLFLEQFEKRHKKSLEANMVNVSKMNEVRDLIRDIADSCIIKT